MKNFISYLLIIFSVFSCKTEPKQFSYTIIGNAIGKDSGDICLFESNRVGDEIFIPIKNGSFKYEGKAYDIYSTFLAHGEMIERGFFHTLPIIVEPGIIEVKIYPDSVIENSRFLKGNINLKIQGLRKKVNKFMERIDDENLTDEQADSLEKIYADSIYILIENNVNNFGSAYLLNHYLYMFNNDQLSILFSKITDSKIKKSIDFKTAFSQYLSKKNNYNKTGTKAYDFTLPDSGGNMINFHSVNKNKMVFVESSGSWCSNQTKESHELDTIYDRYKDKGFEIISVVFESNPERWKKWLQKEKLPWINVMEKEFGNPNDIYISSLIFSNGDYLVNENGFVIANHLSPAKLYELLMKKYEPEKYTIYIETKWKVPDGIYILDKNKVFKSFKELTSHFEGKTFLIDCWASWCSPCIKTFENIKPLINYLDENNIGLAYLCFDTNINDEKWLNIIRKYNLSGNHMRTNRDFINSFSEQTGWKGTLPSYFLVLDNGNEVKPISADPTDIPKFNKEIKKILK